MIELDTWPAPEAWQAGDRLLLPIEPGDDDTAESYVNWLLALAEHRTAHPLPALPHLGPSSIAPFSSDAAGTHRLWAIAVARLVLPARRSAWRRATISSAFASLRSRWARRRHARRPDRAERHLPVAGVPRPDEATITGLRKLIEQAGLECALLEDTAPRMHEVGQQTLRIRLDSLDLRPSARKGEEEPDT